MSKQQSSSGTDVQSVLRIAFLLVLAVVFVWLALTVRLPEIGELREILAGYGAWSWLVFVGAYAVVGLTPIPVTIMAVTGGLLFGPVVGSLLSVAGASVGAVGAYGLARLAGHEVVMKGLGKHAQRVEDAFEDRGFLAIMALRCAPGLPYWPVNYGAGAVGVPIGTFTLASTLGSIPGQVSLVAVGAFIARPGVVNGVIVALAWIAVLGMTWWSVRRWKQERDEDHAEDQPGGQAEDQAEDHDDGRSPGEGGSPSRPAGSADGSD